MIDYVNANLFTESGIDKQLIITCADRSITNELIYAEEFALTQSICSESELKFGGCESGMIEFKIKRVSDDDYFTVNDEITVELVLNKDYGNPFNIGTFFIAEKTTKNDKNYQEITAYDRLYSLKSLDITEWIDGLIYPMTQKTFRTRLFDYVGLDYIETELINDEAILYRSDVNGAIYFGDMLRDMCELNACFGYMNNNDKFVFLTLNTDDDYYDYEITKNTYKQNGFSYDLFRTATIGGVEMKQNNNNETTAYYVSDNIYKIELNVLNLGTNFDDLSQIANNFHEAVKDITYRPFSIDGAIGNYCLECGDKVKVNLKNDTWTSEETTYIFERKITGIQSLSDSYSAQGVEKYSAYNDSTDISGINSSISELKSNTFQAITFTNSLPYIVKQTDIDIIQFNITTAQNDADVIFMATIPITTDYDGTLILTYEINSVAQKYSTVRHNLNQGENIVTVVNTFKMTDMSRMTLTVKARIEYEETVQRAHTAQISALEQYVNTGTYTAPTIDTTAATGTIVLEAVKAVVLAQGLIAAAEWDGTITVSDELTAFDWTTAVEMAEFIDTAEATATEIDTSTVTQTMAPFTWEHTITVSGINEEVTAELNEEE